MSDLAAILCAGLLPTIGIEPARSGGFNSWCLRGDFTAAREPGGVILGRVRASEFANAISFDYERFALSSRETYSVALSERKEFGSVSWPLLKHYYSAFFAAHAIMRSRAAGVIKLEKKQADFISDMVQLYEPGAQRLNPGMFILDRVHRPDDRIGEISLTLKEDKAKKGVHESFWLNFCEYLAEEASRAVANGDPDGSEFVAFSAELREAILSGGGSSAWLSGVRNQINYQHDYEAWLPCKKSSQSLRSLESCVSPTLKTARLDFSKNKNPVDAFLNISCYISGLSFAVSEYIAARSTKGGAFGQKWKKLQGLLSSE